DQLEGYSGPGKNNYYDRIEQIVHAETKSFRALVYVLPKGKQLDNMKRIESGDWRRFRLR
ncbi:MAG: gamma-glutamylcyclotransferase, partial [Bacillus sp. (in: firmicutes)]